MKRVILLTALILAIVLGTATAVLAAETGNATAIYAQSAKYGIILGKSHASADEALANAVLQVNAAGAKQVVGIAAALGVACCDFPELNWTPGVEWNVYILIKK